MNKDKFIKHMAKTGEVTSEEFVLFLLEHYLMNEKSLNDYYNDLIDQYSSTYALACVEHAKKVIKAYVKKKGRWTIWQ